MNVRVKILASGIVHFEAMFAAIFLGGAAACLTADCAIVVVGLAIVVVYGCSWSGMNGD